LDAVSLSGNSGARSLPPRLSITPALSALAILGTLLLTAGTARAVDGPTVNARNFGTLQQAGDSLPRSGGTVEVPAGVYDVHDKIRLRSHVELRGEGIDRTILVLADGVRDHLISNADLVQGNTDITIRDLQLQGNRDGQRVWRFDNRLAIGRTEVWSFGVRFNNVSDSLIQNVEASGFTKDGFYLGYNRYNGVYRTRIIGCRARDNGRNGISLTHGSYNIIDGCDIRDNNRVEQVSGIDLEPDLGLEGSHNLVLHNYVAGQHAGISLYNEPPTWQGAAVLVANAVCYNVADRNSFVGIWDHEGQGNYFVDNAATGSENNVGPSATTRNGSAYADQCVH